MIVRLQGNIDDDSRDMQALLVALGPIHGERTTRKWQLRCGEVNYFGPWAVSAIAAAFLEGRRIGQAPRIVLPKEPGALGAYCMFSGMAHLLRQGPAPLPDHPECETIPLEKFETASWDRSNRIIGLLNRHTTLDPDREDQIRTCVQEVIQNVVDHAESPIGGVMSARYMAQRREIRVGIVDRGVGIAVKLGAKYPEVGSSLEALNRVIEGGYSSRSRPNNQGLGVSNLFGLCGSSGGRIAMFTGNAFAEVHPGVRPTTHTMGCVFPGTAVFFALPVGAMGAA